MEKMRAGELLHIVNEKKKYNNYDLEESLRVLQMVEDRIQQELISTHENPENIEIGKIDEDSMLTAAGPYIDIYIHYLMAMMDKDNEEYDRYNNNMALFNEAYNDYCTWYNRNYMPISKGKFQV